MDITLNVIVTAPGLEGLLKQLFAEAKSETVKNTRTLGDMLKNNSGAPAADALTTGGAQAPAADVTAKPPAKPRGKKTDAPAAAEASAPAPAAAATTLTLAVVRARLGDYSADKRYGMKGVTDLLGKYGVTRISDLPEAKYDAFHQEIDEALAGSDPLS